MRLVTKEDNISTLIERGKKMLSSDKYLFVTTIDMIDQLEMSLETFCKKIDQKTMISGHKEKTLKLLQDTEGVFPVGVSRFELVILGIKKELIEKEELEKFVNVDEELLPIIQVINSLDGSEILPQGNKEELDWFIDKIHGKKIEYTDHYAVSFTESPLANAEANNSLEELSWGKATWEPKIERFRPSAMVYETVAWHLVEGGKFDMAENFHKLAIGLDPEYYFAMEQLAQLYLTEKRPAKVLPLLEKAIEINPKFSYLKLVLGYYYIATRKFDHALLEFEKIDLELPFPDMEKVSIILMKSKAKLLMGDLDAALSYCIEASTLCSPDKPINDTENSLYFAWSEILKRKGDYQ
ncbi:hypothetical protein HX833_03900, partial [Marine Group I thaumarchaeote]|nr:hypothetical protein [Marine Group I thaumarchaeote]